MKIYLVTISSELGTCRTPVQALTPEAACLSARFAERPPGHTIVTARDLGLVVPAGRFFAFGGQSFEDLSTLAAIILANPDATFETLAAGTGHTRARINRCLDTLCKLIEARTGRAPDGADLRAIGAQLR